MSSPDVLIAGAGPAGCVAALVLARAGVRVRLLDRAQFPRPKLCGDTLNPGTIALLTRLGVGTLPLSRGTPLEGMVVTGEGNARVEARYPAGVRGRVVSRCELDAWLLSQALAAGVDFESGVRVTGATGGARITGVQVHTRRGASTIAAALTIAADGRHSTLAFGRGLARHPPAPRRWAIGAYFSDVDGLTSFGEMHVRRGRYIGVAPLPGGLANVCLVLPHPRLPGGLSQMAAWLHSQVMLEKALAERMVRARAVTPATVLGPLAVDATVAGSPGLLLAGDAAGFVDPMTGDGMYFAVRGGELAAAAALAAFGGRTTAPHEWLQRRRAREFARKRRFNRALRALAARPAAVAAASIASYALPWLVGRVVRIAGDVGRTSVPVATERNERTKGE